MNAGAWRSFAPSCIGATPYRAREKIRESILNARNDCDGCAFDAARVARCWSRWLSVSARVKQFFFVCIRHVSCTRALSHQGKECRVRRSPVEISDALGARSACDGEAVIADLGGETVRLARIAAALHMSQAAALLAGTKGTALWRPSAEGSQ